MEMGHSQLSVEREKRDSAVLPDDVRQHLGRLLGTAYESNFTEQGTVERFADLLASLEATLDEASRRDAAEFQAQLLAVIPALRRFAISLIRDRTAADDLVQETLLRAWRHRARFEMGTKFEAWTFTILRNQFYNGQRKASELADVDGAQAARLATVPEQAGHLDLIDVQAALAQLAPPMREALMLVTVEDLSYEEAATLMQCQLGTVKSRVSRARDQLVRALGYTGAEIGNDAATLSAMLGTGEVRG